MSFVEPADLAKPSALTNISSTFNMTQVSLTAPGIELPRLLHQCNWLFSCWPPYFLLNISYSGEKERSTCKHYNIISILLTSLTWRTDKQLRKNLFYFQSLLMYNLTMASLTAPEIQPTRRLHDCHSDWINGCAWSDISDHIVSSCEILVITFSLFSSYIAIKVQFPHMILSHPSPLFMLMCSYCDRNKMWKIWPLFPLLHL